MILITGITGFLGSVLAKKLIDKGYSVAGLCRSSSSKKNLSDYASKIQWHEGDILDYFSLEEALQNKKWLIHAAGFISFHGKDQKKLFKVNEEGTLNVVNAALEYGKIERFCHISSVAALGRSYENSPISEKTEWQYSSQNSIYARSKKAGEREVFRGFAEGLKGFIVNPSIILGGDSLEYSSMKIIEYAFKNPIFYPVGNLNYVDVRDVTDTIIKLLESDCTGERFIINAETISYLDFFRTIAKIHNTPIPTTAITPFLGEIFWRIEKIRGFFKGKLPLLTKETVRSSTRKYCYDHSKILNYFPDFRFKTLEETLKSFKP